MKALFFTKMVATGNDFVVVEQTKELKACNKAQFARGACDRKYGFGADGVLLLEKSQIADTRMRIFNADGSEAEMCGNGARCAALYLNCFGKNHKSSVTLETLAGVIHACVNGTVVKVKLPDPKGLKLDIPLKVMGKSLKVNFINTGVPHAVIFVEGLSGMHIIELGRALRNHKAFGPRGTNVNFVEVRNVHGIDVRTYERGVEDETLACGTGSTASALIFAIKSSCTGAVTVKTRSGEDIKVHYKRSHEGFTDVWLQGRTVIVYKGVCHV